MTARIAINGFGRVERLSLGSIFERHKDHLSVVALNNLVDL
jgi:glyceraldehyde-3-phosphate dehydrogenase/erythrose-4-phosphate dehydrogenase